MLASRAAMLAKYIILLASLLGTSALAGTIPMIDYKPLVIDQRVRDQGGWSMTMDINQTCPSATHSCGPTWCCPSSLTCLDTSGGETGVCCPGSVNCLAAYQDTPSCADNTWSLWNSTFSVDGIFQYFCCDPDSVGLPDGTCIDTWRVTSTDEEAQRIHPLSTTTTVAAPTYSTQKSRVPVLGSVPGGWKAGGASISTTTISVSIVTGLSTSTISPSPTLSISIISISGAPSSIDSQTTIPGTSLPSTTSSTVFSSMPLPTVATAARPPSSAAAPRTSNRQTTSKFIANASSSLAPFTGGAEKGFSVGTALLRVVEVAAFVVGAL